MADQDFTHTAEIIKAAMPYVDTKTKGIAEVFAKLLDLMGSFKLFGKSDKMVTYGVESIKIDVEGLLKGIRPICSIKEREIVDRILNIFNMKRMFEMYNNMMSAMKTMQDMGGFNFGDFGAGNDAENVTGNFTGSNFESIFQNFSNFTGQSNGSTDSENNTSHFESFHNTEAGKNDPKPSKEPSPSPEKEKSSASSSAGGFNMNNPMFEMLKTMIPPEQQSTFENLSMLLNTMSYDNNSKSDDNKEHNDG